MTGMVGRVTLLWVPRRNVVGIVAVMTLQNRAVIYPIQLRRMFVVMKKSGMRDALVTSWLPSATLGRMTSPSYCPTSMLVCVCTIRSTPLRTGRIGGAIWTLSFVCAAVVVVCFSAGKISNGSHYLLSNVVIFMVAAQRVYFHTSGFRCYLFRCLLFLHIINPSSRRTGPGRPIFGIWQIRNT